MKKAFIILVIVSVIFSCNKASKDLPESKSNYRPILITSNENEINVRVEFSYKDDKLSEEDMYIETDGSFYLFSKTNYQYEGEKVICKKHMSNGGEWIEVARTEYTINDSKLTQIDIDSYSQGNWELLKRNTYEYADNKLKNTTFSDAYEETITDRYKYDYYYNGDLIKQCDYILGSLDWEVHRHEVFLETDSTWEITLIRNSDSLLWEKSIYTKEDGRYVRKDFYGADGNNGLFYKKSEFYIFNSNGLLSEINYGFDEFIEESVYIEYEEGVSNIEQLQDPHEKAKNTLFSFVNIMDKSIQEFKKTETYEF